MPTKIKHSALSNQSDLHEPKLHSNSHKRLGADPVISEDLFTNEASTKKVLQPTGANNVQAWTNALTVNTVAADATVQAGTGISTTSGGVTATAGNITATDGDIEMSANNHKLYVGANATDGTYAFGRYNLSNDNYPLITKRVSNTYNGRPAYFCSQNFTYRGHFDNNANQTNWCGQVSSLLTNQRHRMIQNPTITGTPNFNIGTTVTGILTAEISTMEYFTVTNDSYCSKMKVTGARTAGSGTIQFAVLERPAGTADGGDCIVRQRCNIPTTTTEVFTTSTGHIDTITGANFDNATELAKHKVAEGSVLFFLGICSSDTLDFHFNVQVELIPCN